METNKLVIGILAHVDAGKTTLSEGILYNCGSIRSLGRVDHGNAFFDTNRLERERGITIFSKQAQFKLGEKEFTLLDTPGHVDFATEMERTLQVLDYAILVINGADGVQSHTVTLWKLLEAYKIPVFVFINKMDQIGTDKAELLKDLQKRLDHRCIDFGEQRKELLYDGLAMCHESLMEEYLSCGKILDSSIAEEIGKRNLFPCRFGSALKSEGIQEFMELIDSYTAKRSYPNEFGARVYKITRDAQGNRITHMKITGGVLKVKTALSNNNSDGELWQEKVDQIRVYSGNQFNTINEAESGSICAVLGLSKTYSGQGLGVEPLGNKPILEPVLSYEIKLPPSCDKHGMFLKFKQLEEEDPQLNIVWNDTLNQFHAQIMGEIEVEILKDLILERFGIEVEFGEGEIVYKETISDSVIGVGHFEPLRHYAEVLIAMEPAPGAGIIFDNRCNEDMLDKNWQRLILSHLAEKKHKGVLIGADITDIKITLIAGRAHKKHTEGGDFRQATYRAVRQGLKKANCILLEPFYEFNLEIPTEMVGRALGDIQRMGGTFNPPVTEKEIAFISGTAPVARMRNYHTDVASYTKGNGRLSCRLKGYEPCHNAEDIIKLSEYNSEADIDNPTGSVFCSKGSGFIVDWDKVEDYAHIDSKMFSVNNQEDTRKSEFVRLANSGSVHSYANEQELEEIFAKTYGPIKRDRPKYKRVIESPVYKSVNLSGSLQTTYSGTKEKYLLVDGYNIIFAWKDLKEVATVSLEGARQKLMDILCNYKGYKSDTEIILVFDAYKVEGGKGSVMDYNNIHVIYTREAETADQYIERSVHKMGRNVDITVATSDNQIQMIIWGDGARKISAKDFEEEIELINEKIRQSEYLNNKGSKNYPLQMLKDAVENNK
ncbi:MAG: NYN domain-containing protein [Aminipila sp.]